MADVSEFLDHTNAQLAAIAADGLTKRERLITSPQGSRIAVGDRQAINLCANNYLGLANHPVLRAAADEAMETHGYGMASVRFICGTQDLHRELELRIARWLGHDDSILFASCFDANGALFEPLLGPEDAIISDALNHASIIDGIRLCKAKRYRYANSDMADLEAQLQKARADGARFIMIATDGVFSMDGYLAKMPEIRALADQYGALVMVDDCHSAGILGPKGAGTAAHFGTRADVITGTLGKALGGALGGYIAGPQPVIDLLRQRARPYLFSNALPPAITAAGIAAIDLIEGADDLRADLFRKTKYWRDGLAEAGFDLLPGETAIVPVMLGEATLAQQMAAELDKRGVFVAGFFFPVVPRGQARIRTQMNAAIAMEDLDIALQAFREAGKENRSDLMKALVKAKPEVGLWMQDEPVPEIGPSDVLIRIRKTGICGTDIHIWNWDEWAQRTVPVPMITGHEFAGEIVELGRDVKDLKVGQRVSGEGHLIGTTSRQSRSGQFHLDPETKGIGVNVQGAFAQYLRLPAFNVVPLPDSVPDRIGAILDPLGNAVHTALSFNLIGEDVLITGAGPIGIMAAAVARHVGARHVVITDVNQSRLDLAAKVADVVPVNVASEDLNAVRSRLGMRQGFDVGLEMSGNPRGFDQMVELMVMGGRIAMLGIPPGSTPVDWSNIVLKSLTIKGIYGREIFETWYKMLAMLENGLDISGVITHEMPVDSFVEGFETMRAGQSGKIVLDWD